MFTRRCSAQISPEAHAKLKKYAQLTGQSISGAVAEIVDDWMETIGTARVETIMDRAHSDLLRGPQNVLDISSGFSC
jgi:hypothetical protein